MRTRVPDLDLLVDLDRLIEINQRLLVDRARRIRVLDVAGQTAVVRTDADVEEGKVRLDGDRLFVLGDGQVILCQGLQDIGVDAVDIHPLAGIRPLERLLDDQLGLVPLPLVQQDLGIVGQRQGVGVVELLGDQRFLFGLLHEVLDFIGAVEVRVRVPVQGEGPDGTDRAVLRGELDSLGSRFECLEQAVPFFGVGDQKCGRIGLYTRQLSPGLGIVRVLPERLLIGQDGAIQVPGFHVRVALFQKGGDCTCRDRRRLEQRLNIPTADLLEKPDTTEQHYHPDEHTVDIGLRPAVEKRTAWRYVHGVAVAAISGISGSGVSVGSGETVVSSSVDRGISVGGFARFSSQTVIIVLAASRMIWAVGSSAAISTGYFDCRF